jgi:hypothetical protein
LEVDAAAPSFWKKLQIWLLIGYIFLDKNKSSSVVK